VTLFAHPNAHPYDSDLIVSDQDGRVIKFDSKNNVRNYWYNNCVNAGLYVMNKSFCRHIVEPQKIDLEKEILAVMAEQGEPIYAYISPEYVKDVGTVDRIEATMKELSSGLIQKRNLENPFADAERFAASPVSQWVSIDSKKKSLLARIFSRESSKAKLDLSKLFPFTEKEVKAIYDDFAQILEDNKELTYQDESGETLCLYDGGFLWGGVRPSFSVVGCFVIYA